MPTAVHKRFWVEGTHAVLLAVKAESGKHALSLTLTARP